MANDYFDPTSYQIVDGTTGDAADVNNLSNALETSFDKLPTETNLKEGTTTAATDSGAADAYVVTLAHSPGTYTDLIDLAMKIGTTNTGNSTVNVNGLGAKKIVNSAGGELAAGDLLANSIVTMRYSSDLVAGGAYVVTGMLPGDKAKVDANTIAVAALASGSGVVVSANDTTVGYLNGKLVAGEGIEFTENNDGGNETLTIVSPELSPVKLHFLSNS